MEADLVKRASSLAIEANSTTNRSFYLFNNPSRYAIFAFRGSGTLDDWYSGTGKSFGNTPVDLKVFTSLRSIGNDEVAEVNAKFFQQFRDLLKEDLRLSDEVRRFDDLLKDSRLSSEVRRAVNEKRTVVFTGYSSGGPIAILATILFLQQNRIPAWCVTFGSPLVGNQIFGHALRRENWAQYFVHFVMRYDIIPRVLLSPLSSIKGKLQTLLPCFNSTQLESIARSQEASSSFYDIVRNASSLASHTACTFMGCTNSLLLTVTSFIELTPYRPFGTYVFCTGKGRMSTVKNPDAILQLLFYSLQLENPEALTEVACRSFKDHLQYGNEISANLGKEDVVDLEHLLLQLPLSSSGAGSNEMGSIETFIKELGLSTRAMLCLTAARESEKQKQRNQDRIDNNRDKIREGLKKLQEYKARGEMREVGYYDAFKQQMEAEDFQANVTRLELAGIWDEIIEMLKRYELPDSFEGRKEWIELGTKFRRLMEPLDIANYYRHSKDEDTGPYMQPKEVRQPRPKRYRYTQRWLEYAESKPVGHFSESCFWAEVENLRIHTDDQRDRVPMLDKNVSRWVQAGLLGRDVFFEKTTFVKWWENLPSYLCNGTRIAALVQGEGRQLAFYAD
ncbi:protein EDS1B-like [Telopea speciosissima]|uniref:protein EDS1B-like n=1 Tax=Telopea speciosissima TaxID=54955 RepID=UPI001CC3B364|nr:protein EDS1B-like [Telopea speciosissima]